MKSPYTSHISTFGEIGEGARIYANIGEIAYMLPIPDKIKDQLEIFSSLNLDNSLSIISEKSSNAKTEGRGIYQKSIYNDKKFYVYTKGIGSMENFRFFRGSDNPLKAFGPDITGSYFHDPLLFADEFPRLIGASYKTETDAEFINAVRVMVDSIHYYGYNSLDDLLENGIPIPISAGVFPGLTQYLKSKASEELDDNRYKWPDGLMVGSVSIANSSSNRIELISESALDMCSASRLMGKALRNLITISRGIYYYNSMHTQNFYLDKTAHLPIADFADIHINLSDEILKKLIKGLLYRTNDDIKIITTMQNVSFFDFLAGLNNNNPIYGEANMAVFDDLSGILVENARKEIFKLDDRLINDITGNVNEFKIAESKFLSKSIINSRVSPHN